MTVNTFRDNASALAGMGYLVFPLRGKSEHVLPNGCNGASNNQNVVSHWSTHYPDANIGIKCGNILVLDLDVKDGKNGADDLLEIVHELGSLPEGPESMTGSGGAHLFFKRPAVDVIGQTGVKWNGRKTGIDIRVGNQYIVAPPSIHPDTTLPYRWAKPVVPVDELPELPQAWIEKFLPVRSQGITSNNLKCNYPPPLLPSGDKIIERAVKYLDAMPESVSGAGGHNALFTAVGALVWGFDLDPHTVKALILNQFNPRCQPPWSEREIDHKINDSLRSPMDKPKGFLIESDNFSDILPRDNFLCGQLGPISTAPMAQLESTQTLDITEDDDELDPDLLRIGEKAEQFPQHLLHVPGFVGEFADYINRTSFTIQPNLALAASLCVLATLTGRRVQDCYRTRTNIYVIGTADTGDGKDRAREVAKKLFEEIEKPHWISERLMSYQGLIRTIDENKTVMLAWDEFGRVLGTINKDKNSHKSEIPTALLTLYSSANNTYYSDVRADKRHDKIIKQPHLVVYGTSVPESLYQSMGEDSLTNGLMGRMLIFDGVEHPIDQKPELTLDGLLLPIPQHLIEIARFWKQFEPGGNMHNENPDPVILKTTPEAEAIYDALLDAKRATRVSRDPVRKALWSRVPLKAKQLGMLYACSENHKDPVITEAAARWGADVVVFLTENLLKQTSSWVADDEFGRKTQEFIRYLQGVGGVASATAVNNRFFRWGFWRENVIKNLLLTKIVVLEEIKTKGRPTQVYRLKTYPKK